MANSGSIESFMRREFGTRANKILSDIYSQLEIVDVSSSSDVAKKKFIAYLEPELRQKSLTKSSFLIAELMSILKIQENVSEGVALKFEDHTRAKDFINNEGHIKVKSIFSKIEAIFNLFWVNAADAFKQGIPLKTIHNLTNQMLTNVKEDLFDITEELASRFNLTLSARKYMVKKTKFDLGSNITHTQTDKSSPIKIMLDDFNNEVEGYYEEFKKLFIQSLDEDIILISKGNEDDKLIEETKEKTRLVWDKIVRAYNKMQRKINSLG